MPKFQVDVQMHFAGEYWTNRWFVSASDLSAANTLASGLCQNMRDFHSTNVTFDRYRVSDGVKGTDIYVITPLGYNGQRSVPGSDLLPLFNVVRVDYGASAGRPSRKYFRGVLGEADVSSFNIGIDLLGLVSTAQSALVAEGWLLDVDGQTLTSATVFQAVAMRQLRRGSKRRANPIIAAE